MGRIKKLCISCNSYQPVSQLYSRRINKLCTSYQSVCHLQISSRTNELCTSGSYLPISRLHISSSPSSTSYQPICQLHISIMTQLCTSSTNHQPGCQLYLQTKH